MLPRGELQKDAINSNFENFENALYMSLHELIEYAFNTHIERVNRQFLMGWYTNAFPPFKQNSYRIPQYANLYVYEILTTC